MSWAHIHLLLNHVPVIGLVVTIPLLAWGVIRRERVIIRLGLFMLASLAVVAIAVYLTGEPAEELVEDLAGVSHAIIESHEEAALIATILLGGVGAMASAGLIFIRSAEPPVRFGALVLAMSLVPMGAMAYTSNLGGQIRHSEIRAENLAIEAAGPIADENWEPQ